MKAWTELEAISWLNKNSPVTVQGKKITAKKNKGVGGLTACSAVSFLREHCKYLLVCTNV